MAVAAKKVEARVSRVPAVTSEILASTLHLFVPLQTLIFIGPADFGIRTWAGCALAFGADVTLRNGTLLLTASNTHVAMLMHHVVGGR